MNYTCFATGHRPPKAGGYGNHTHHDKIVDFLYAVVLEAIKEDYSTFVSGGALGMDQWFAKAVLMAKALHNVHLVMALPFQGFEAKWSISSQAELGALCKQADQTIYVCEPGYQPWKMQKRNEYMVDMSNCGVALYDGSGGGTNNCIKYARKLAIPLLVIHPITLEWHWEGI